MLAISPAHAPFANGNTPMCLFSCAQWPRGSANGRCVASIPGILKHGTNVHVSMKQFTALALLRNGEGSRPFDLRCLSN